jgi:hypothetical protein
MLFCEVPCKRHAQLERAVCAALQEASPATSRTHNCAFHFLALLKCVLPFFDSTPFLLLTVIRGAMQCHAVLCGAVRCCLDALLCNDTVVLCCVVRCCAVQALAGVGPLREALLYAAEVRTPNCKHPGLCSISTRHWLVAAVVVSSLQTLYIGRIATPACQSDGATNTHWA